MGFTEFAKEVNVYASAPDTPNVVTKQIYPVHVMHGYVRYLAQKDLENFRFWRQTLGANVGIPLILAVVTWLTYGHRPVG